MNTKINKYRKNKIIICLKLILLKKNNVIYLQNLFSFLGNKL